MDDDMSGSTRRRYATSAAKTERKRMPGAHPKLGVTDGLVGLDGAESLPLKERAYELIRLDVLTFRLKPGEKTSERALEARYGLGVASVRAALPRLVQEGLVEKTSERGTFIAPLTLRGVRDTYQMRYLLEPAAAELAAERGMDPARLDQLRQVCESQWAPGDDDAVIHILLANRDFNLAIAEATGNSLLARTIRHLQNLSLRILFLATSRHDAANFWGAGPGKIRDAIVARNGPLARELYTADLAEGERLALRVIMALPALERVNLADLNTARSRRAGAL
jgi:DNA-binding GntR family transcriptional regulator